MKTSPKTFILFLLAIALYIAFYLLLPSAFDREFHLTNDATITQDIDK